MLEFDESYKNSDIECGTITCAAPGCEVKVRYSAEVATRPRYCKKHVKELESRGRSKDTHVKNPPLVRKTLQEIVEGEP